ncbi:MAG: ATP-binding cassette domain-containing protein, partial [Hyphomicrobiales bacterium]|nr:ATP-binding cassette domain-containing protein [Hyphomicrobiales bacterium]
MASLTLDTITKSFGQLEILHGIDLDIADGEFVVFVGPSGCGKSTLLRVIAGLEPATGGTIAIDGEDVTHHSAAARGLAMVFQSYALYPHMSVYDNLAFGLENMRMPKDRITQRVQTAATLLQIDKLLQRKPGQLSGGQRQRVAIGRAITRNPKIFLFDEPLSNLDAELRVQMRIELSKLHKDLKATMIYGTHDQVEAMTMADKIVVLRDGRIEQIGKPLDLYNHPANKFVAGFIGSPRMNFISARVTACSANHVSVTASGLQETTLPVNGTGLAQGETVSLGIR